MPNWVYNTLTIQGPKSEIDFIKDKLNEPFTVWHDSWNVDTGKMEVSESIYSAPVLHFGISTLHYKTVLQWKNMFNSLHD